MKLEDLTKEELLRLIKNRWFYPPTERDILETRHYTLLEEAKRVLDQATEDSHKWTGDKTIEGYRKWADAQELFDKGMKLYDKASAIHKEIMSLKP
ncbi:MAG: hypothetical protein PHQ86_06465 [Dehalococcoidales bacterium]|nr:hypothetical protein [Dehalococcoidales bacterium]